MANLTITAIFNIKKILHPLVLSVVWQIRSFDIILDLVPPSSQDIVKEGKEMDLPSEYRADSSTKGKLSLSHPTGIPLPDQNLNSTRNHSYQAALV